MAEEDGVVVAGVAGGVEEGDFGVGGEELPEAGEGGVGGEFGGVARAEFVPAVLGVGVKPFSEAGGGGYLLVPEVVFEVGVREAARPQSVYVDAEAVVGGGGLVGPADVVDGLHDFRTSVGGGVFRCLCGAMRR